MVDTLYSQDTSEYGWIEHQASGIKEFKGHLGGRGVGGDGVFPFLGYFPGAALKTLEDFPWSMTAAAGRQQKVPYVALREGVERKTMSCLTTDETLSGAKS